MDGFEKNRVSLPGTGRRFGRESVDVWSRRGDARWAEIGAELYGGRLSGLKEVKRSDEAAVYITEDLQVAGSYYFKRFFMRDRLDFLKHFFRRARALRELHGAQLAASAGIQVPETCCVLVKRRHGMVTESAIITKAVADAKRFPEYYREMCPPGQAAADSRCRLLALSLAREVANWHEQFICHGEMHLGNVLCRENAGAFDFIWVDNERTRTFKGLYDQVRNLAELNKVRVISRHHRMAFWARYCRLLKIDKHRRHLMLRKVMRKTKHASCQTRPF